LTGSRTEYDEICRLPIEQKRTALKVFKTTAYWGVKHETIFFQRPLKSQKKFIGKCQYEKNKRTAPSSSLLFQEFRIRKQLSDVRYSDVENEIRKQPLPYEWKIQLYNYLKINRKLNLREGNKKKDGTKNADVMDVLGLQNKKRYKFNFDNGDDDKVFEGNQTLYAIYTACGVDLFNELEKQNRLEKLWHLIYMAKDDEWLKDTLLSNWILDPDIVKNEEIVNKLVEMGLEEGFGNYSSKVLKNILPFMRDGKDEYDAKVLANYEKAPDEVKDEEPLKAQISQLKNNELRNPVVERAVAQTIKLVNTIIGNGTYNIDQEHLTIRIESTREFKKPKTEREKIRRGNSEKEKKREEYAKFLNEKRQEGKLSFVREIYKNDSIIGKFELWLELGGDKDEPSFKEFEKVAERKDREKHALWLECNRICPYTGKVISLSKLFSSDVEIEHIIPYSRSLDDSFANKTVTFCEVNKEKGDKTAYEYLKGKGERIFNEFKSRIKVFGKEKEENKFLLDKVPTEFSNAQITNTSYIAKYVRKKLQEVCWDVQFTNGSATGELRKNDWRLGNVLDKIRYEEETGIDIDDYFREIGLYKKDFEVWRSKKANSTDVLKTDWRNITPETTLEYEMQTKNPLYEWWQKIQDFETFRGGRGKKDRSDHRHHLLDAIITACCSRSIVQQLSTLNQTRERQGYSMYDGKGNLTRRKIECPLKYEQIKEALRGNLIYHKSDQKLITSKVNRIKISKEKGGLVKQKTFAVRGSLVGDNFYGKLKNPRHQGFDRDIVYVKRVTLNGENFKDKNGLDKIVDSNVKKILQRRLESSKYAGKGEKAFSEEAMKNDPVYLYSVKKYPNGIPENPVNKDGNMLPVIKKVRVANKNSRNLIQLAAKSDERDSAGKRIILNKNRYAEADGNYVMALYEKKQFDAKGRKKKSLREFEIVSLFESVRRKSEGKRLFSDEKNGIGLMESCPYLIIGDMVVMYEEDESEINWEDLDSLQKRLYRVSGMSSEEKYGILSFVKHDKTSQNASYGKAAYKYGSNQISFASRHTQLNIVKVSITQLGKIERLHG